MSDLSIVVKRGGRIVRRMIGFGQSNIISSFNQLTINQNAKKR